MDLTVIYTVMRDGCVLGQGELTHILKLIFQTPVKKSFGSFVIVIF